jgi:hypothetical protein
MEHCLEQKLYVEFASENPALITVPQIPFLCQQQVVLLGAP